MEKRLGFVGLIIEDREKNAAAVNALLSEFGELILARTGVPCPERNCSAITLVIDATTDELGSDAHRPQPVDHIQNNICLSIRHFLKANHEIH